MISFYKKSCVKLLEDMNLMIGFFQLSINQNVKNLFGYLCFVYNSRKIIFLSLKLINDFNFINLLIKIFELFHYSKTK